MSEKWFTFKAINGFSQNFHNDIAKCNSGWTEKHDELKQLPSAEKNVGSTNKISYISGFRFNKKGETHHR